MIVTIPFALIRHLLLVFFITSQRVSSHRYSYEPDEGQIEEFDGDYYNDVGPNSFGRVLVAEESLGTVVGTPHSQPCDDYYYMDQPVVRRQPKKSFKRIPESDCSHFKEIIVSSPPRYPPPFKAPVPPPFRAPLQVFDDSDMC